MEVRLNWPTEDRESVVVPLDAVPRIGEKIGAVHISGAHYRLDKVVDVRHYIYDGKQEIQVLLEP